ncbi:hypothetical protein AB3K78_15485 [Leucobacter sp. HNU]|uniref:hypothetical protein n=1 Tax=Leucobacter sp. HNU TaxID=3236805 RepID=UPI003A80C083
MEQQSSERKTNRIIVIVIAAMLAVAGIGAAAYALSPKDDRPIKYGTPTPDAGGDLDREMAASGWSVGKSGDTYYRFLAPDDASAAKCDFGSCATLEIQSRDGCAKGFYVKADVLRDGTAVAWTNGTSPSARGGELVRLKLSDPSGDGNSMRVSEFRCMGS